MIKQTMQLLFCAGTIYEISAASFSKQITKKQDKTKQDKTKQLTNFFDGQGSVGLNEPIPRGSCQQYNMSVYCRCNQIIDWNGVYRN